MSANLTFDRLIMGFMGLGLIVDVAALGVITARSVVERRQQIGVLRSIGFRRSMVGAIFLLESAFVALTSILVGTGLGLIVAHNVIADSQRQGTFANLADARAVAHVGSDLCKCVRDRDGDHTSPRAPRRPRLPRRGFVLPVSLRESGTREGRKGTSGACFPSMSASHRDCRVFVVSRLHREFTDASQPA